MKPIYVNQLPIKAVTELRNAFILKLVDLNYDTDIIKEELQYFTDSKIDDIYDSVSPELINKYVK